MSGEGQGEKVWEHRTDLTDPDEITEQFLNFLRMTAGMREGSVRKDPRWVWQSCEALILGMVGTPTIVDDISLPDGVTPGTIKECFHNAFLLSARSSNLLYTEGFAQQGNGLFPMNHAWCTDVETGRIVDPTWVNLPTKGPTVYMGLRFSKGFMDEAIRVSKGIPSIFESDWARKGRTIRKGLTLDADGVVVAWGDPPPF